MTREEAIENIKLMRFNAALTNANSFREALDMAIEALSQPSFPSNLYEAAEDSWAVYEYRESPRGLYSTCYVDGFKAGAEWMAGQGYTKEETVYFERLCDENRIMVDLGWGEPERGGFNPGDKVIVQIRKKQ